MSKNIIPYGLSLRIARIKARLRQFELAAQVGLHPSRLSLIEADRVTPRPKELQRLREVLAKAGQDE